MKRSLLWLMLLLTLLPATAQAQDSTCEDGLRLFDHESLAGEALCIPENPQRVIALDEGTMAELVALGVSPIGVHDYGVRDFTTYLDTSEIESVGTPDGPNYEAMLTLEPDLIVGKAEDVEFFGENAGELLSEIAPTVLSSTGYPGWEDHHLFIGAVLDQEEQAQEQLDTYTQRLNEFRENDGERLSDTTIGIIRSRADSFNVYVEDYFIVDVVTDAGLQFPEELQALEARNSISLEQLDILTSDYLFVMVRNEDEGGYFEEALESPLWGFLPSVQQENVYQVNWSTWVAGWNIIGANLVLDDLYRYLSDDAPSTPNPFNDLLTEDFRTDVDVEEEATATPNPN